MRMANVLNEQKRQQVVALGRLGWPLRRIEDETGVRRETASAYLKAAGVDVRHPGWRRRATAPKPASMRRSAVSTTEFVPSLLGHLGGRGFGLHSHARIIHQASIRTLRGSASWDRCMMRSVGSGAAIYSSTSRVRRFFAVTRTRWSVIQSSSVLVVLRVPLVAGFVPFLISNRPQGAPATPPAFPPLRSRPPDTPRL